jgi:hypothetical protein
MRSAPARGAASRAKSGSGSIVERDRRKSVSLVLLTYGLQEHRMRRQ